MEGKEKRRKESREEGRRKGDKNLQCPTNEKIVSARLHASYHFGFLLVLFDLNYYGRMMTVTERRHTLNKKELLFVSLYSLSM